MSPTHEFKIVTFYVFSVCIFLYIRSFKSDRMVEMDGYVDHGIIDNSKIPKAIQTHKNIAENYIAEWYKTKALLSHTMRIV